MQTITNDKGFFSGKSFIFIVYLFDTLGRREKSILSVMGVNNKKEAAEKVTNMMQKIGLETKL